MGGAGGAGGVLQGMESARNITVAEASPDPDPDNVSLSSEVMGRRDSTESGSDAGRSGLSKEGVSRSSNGSSGMKAISGSSTTCGVSTGTKA